MISKTVNRHNHLNLRVLAIALFSLLLMSCNENDKKEKTNWVNEEILQQLTELRKDVKLIKQDIAKLDSKIVTEVAKRRKKTPTPNEVSLKSGISFGSDSAKIAIVEFTDYECPFCARHSKSVFPQIKEKLIKTGKVKYVMYDFPLGFHKKAKSASIAARCAGKQGKYWEMHDLIFNNQRKLNEQQYLISAKSLNLNQSSFKECLKDKSVSKTVESNITYGTKLGVLGTPRFYVGKIKGDVITNIKVISGAQAYSSFSNAILALQSN